MKKTKKNLLPGKIKPKIKELIDRKVDNITKFSTDLGYSKGFITSILGKSDKFFNLEHIEKICATLNYPVWKLFIEEEQQQGTPLTKEEQKLLKTIKELSTDGVILIMAEAVKRKEQEEQQRGLGKKANAAPEEGGSRGGQTVG
ncbi:MAG: hypothetical protein V3U75_12860 [Methylococcaceae bacterium]